MTPSHPSTHITPPQAGAAPSCSRRATGSGPERVAPVDLDWVDASLDEVRANPLWALQPWALQALRVAELLRAEVDRVAALRVELAAELEDLQAEHAKTCSNFEEFAEGSLETHQQLRRELEVVTADRNRARLELQRIRDGGYAQELLDQRRQHREQIDLLDRCLETADANADRWRRKHDELRAELGRVRARAGWSGVLAAHLRFLVQAIEQAQLAQVGQPFCEAWHAALVAAEQARAALAALDRDQPPAETSPEVRRIRCMPPGHTCPGPFGYCGACPERPAELRTHTEVQAQTLYAGLPNLPAEPAVADDDQPAHWAEHNHHTADAEEA